MKNKKSIAIIFTIVAAIIVLLIIILKPKQYGNNNEAMENIIAEQLETDQKITITNIINMNGIQMVGFVKGNEYQKQVMSLAQFKKDKHGNNIFDNVINPEKIVKRGPDIWVKYISDYLFFLSNNPSLAKIKITNTNGNIQTISVKTNPYIIMIEHIGNSEYSFFDKDENELK